MPAKVIRRTVAATMPMMMAHLRFSNGKVELARPITTAVAGQHEVDHDHLKEGGDRFAGDDVGPDRS
jgi:hypothetical protein